MKVVSAKKIWDKAPHSAMTDLIYFKDHWIVAFRESDAHVYGQDGKIRLLKSKDGKSFKTFALFEEDGTDFRDPKLSITPDGRLMLLIGATTYLNQSYQTMQSRVAFSKDGEHFTPWQKIAEPHEWLWRVTWHQGTAWGISYRHFENHAITLWKSGDGVHFEKCFRLDVPGIPSEATLRFSDQGEMIALIRRDKKRDNHAWIARAKPPYKEFIFTDAGMHLGGPNFLVIGDNVSIACGRLLSITPYGIIEAVVLCDWIDDRLIPKLLLPSGGDDTSYPGMCYRQGLLYISYYSSHEGKAAIYFGSVNTHS